MRKIKYSYIDSTKKSFWFQAVWVLTVARIYGFTGTGPEILLLLSGPCLAQNFIAPMKLGSTLAFNQWKRHLPFFRRWLLSTPIELADKAPLLQPIFQVLLVIIIVLYPKPQRCYDLAVLLVDYKISWGTSTWHPLFNLSRLLKNSLTLLLSN